MITQENMEIQTQNYWYACQRLAEAGTPQTARDHAIAILKAQSAFPSLGHIAHRAREVLIAHNLIPGRGQAKGATS